jgi:hypothetical protein
LGAKSYLPGRAEIDRHLDRRLPRKITRGERGSRSDPEHDGGAKREAEGGHVRFPLRKSLVETMGSPLMQMRMICN